MKPAKCLLACLSALLLIQTLACAAPEKILPRLKLQVGQKFKLKASSDSKMVSTVQGQTQVITDSASLVCTFELLSLDEVGDMTMKVTYDSIRLSEDAPAGKIVYDSTSTSEVPPLVRGIAALVGQSFTMRITPEGRVRSVSGADEIVAKAIEKNNVLSEPWRSALSKQITDRFGNLPTSENMQGMFGVYPDKAVAIGERYSRKFQTAENIIESFYKITDRKDGILTIKCYAKITPNPESPGIQIGLVQMKSEATGTEEGTLQIEEATGMILHISATSKSSGNLLVVSGAPEMRIPTNITGSTKIDKL